jgi:membrane dipeptidase
MPGVLIIEAIAQLAGIMLGSAHELAQDNTGIYYLAKIKEAKFILAHVKELDALKKQGMVQEYALSVLADKYADEVKSNRPPLSALMDHMDYIVKLAGIDHVGIGSDFDGITSSPQDLDGVLDYPNLTKAMLERGYSKKDINKVLGGNLLRVLKANENKL